jgi:type II secretory pathway component PulK
MITDPMPLGSGKRRAGSALLLVLWALLMLSAAVFAFAKWVQQDIVLHGQANREIEARAMAYSGIAIARHPKVSQRTPGLEESFSGALGYKVRIISEGGRLNMRWLLEQGDDPRRLTMLKQWLEQRGLNFEEREILADCLLDWVDDDGDAHRLNGVEAEPDYAPRNAPLESIEEIAQVRGAEALTRTPGWEQDLTLESLGPIDVTAATPEILRLVPGLGEAQITRLLQIRRGRDGVDGTADDNEFKSLADVERFLGFNPQQKQAWAGLVTHQDTTLHIISEGHSGSVYKQVDVVVRKPQILSWKE